VFLFVRTVYFPSETAGPLRHVDHGLVIGRDELRMKLALQLSVLFHHFSKLSKKPLNKHANKLILLFLTSFQFPSSNDALAFFAIFSPNKSQTHK
jgi:hypothetical protein